jgi:hypothetical protein
VERLRVSIEPRKETMRKFMFVGASIAVLALAGPSFAQTTTGVRGGAATAEGGHVEAGGTTGAGGQDSLGAGANSSDSSNVKTGLPKAAAPGTAGSGTSSSMPSDSRFKNCPSTTSSATGSTTTGSAPTPMPATGDGGSTAEAC